MELKTETRKCGDCKHFKKDKFANHIGICTHKLMTVIDTMNVTYKDKTCFENKLTPPTNMETNKQDEQLAAEKFNIHKQYLSDNTDFEAAEYNYYVSKDGFVWKMFLNAMQEYADQQNNHLNEQLAYVQSQLTLSEAQLTSSKLDVKELKEQLAEKEKELSEVKKTLSKISGIVGKRIGSGMLKGDLLEIHKLVHFTQPINNK